MTISQTPASAVAGGGPAPDRASRGRRYPLLAGALAAAWLVPFLAYLAGVAVIVPVLVLAGTASLLRSGRTVLDRLMIALALLFGVTCVGGLLFSVWPWGIHPVAIGGLGLTVLVAISGFTGRRPEVPGLGSLSDLWVVGGAAGFAAAMAWPFLVRSFSGKFALIVSGEDLARHFFLYDTIRTHGGFPWMDKAGTATEVKINLVAYPQGAHMNMAVLDNFVRSSTADGSTTTALHHFMWFYVAAVVFLCLALLWAIRWVAGPTVLVWRWLPVAVAVVGLLFWGDGTAMFLRGFMSEFVGLGLLAMTMAVLVRPLSRHREQLLVLAALLTAVSFTYYLFLPVCGLMALVWMITRRATLLTTPVWTGVLAVLTVVLTAVTPVVNYLNGYGSAEELNSTGGISPVNRHLLFLLLLVAGLGFLSRSAWRNPVRRNAGVWLALCSVGAFGMFAYQTWALHKTTYYYEKVLHQLIVVAVVALAASPFVTRDWSLSASAQRRRPVMNIWTAGALSASLFAALLLTAGPDRPVFRKPPGELSWGAAYLKGKMLHKDPADVILAGIKARKAAHADNRANMIQVSRNPEGAKWQSNYFGNQWTGALSRNYGASWPSWPSMGAEAEPKDLRDLIIGYGKPLRVLTDDPVTFATVQKLRQERPDLNLELYFSAVGTCTYDFKPVAAGVFTPPQAAEAARC
ncbi:hypothetical protein [Yinghuangia seranimata]|uniref:hypothetical protein n=1 Tax=Yinghuangia seranimata TaxID=408067 RepID=UPI00248AF8F5|nr:hypothetical protein [Yinghuangia seranimata]MDI2131713.1 hypothetical protein [Yinghuangia seranimata]